MQYNVIEEEFMNIDEKYTKVYAVGADLRLNGGHGPVTRLLGPKLNEKYDIRNRAKNHPDLRRGITHSLLIDNLLLMIIKPYVYHRESEEDLQSSFMRLAITCNQEGIKHLAFTPFCFDVTRWDYVEQQIQAAFANTDIDIVVCTKEELPNPLDDFEGDTMAIIPVELDREGKYHADFDGDRIELLDGSFDNVLVIHPPSDGRYMVRFKRNILELSQEHHTQIVLKESAEFDGDVLRVSDLSKETIDLLENYQRMFKGVENTDEDYLTSVKMGIHKGVRLPSGYVRDQISDTVLSHMKTIMKNHKEREAQVFIDNEMSREEGEKFIREHLDGDEPREVNLKTDPVIPIPIDGTYLIREAIKGRRAWLESRMKPFSMRAVILPEKKDGENNDK